MLYLIKRKLHVLDIRQRSRFAGFSLYVSNSDVSTSSDIKSSNLCYQDRSPTLPPLNFTTLCLRQGRYVVFYNERLIGGNYPENYATINVFTELCEVIVKGKIYSFQWLDSILSNDVCLSKTGSQRGNAIQDFCKYSIKNQKKK